MHFRKVLRTAGHEEIRPGRLGTFQKPIVRLIAGHCETPGRMHHPRRFLEFREGQLDIRGSQLELPPSQNFRILIQNLL